MIARVMFNHINVSDKVLRGGVQSLTGMTFDDDGLQSMGEATVRFSDLDGFFGSYVRTPQSIPVTIDVETNAVFVGFSSQEGLECDPSTEIATCQILPAGADDIAALKDMPMQDVADAGSIYKKQLGIFTEVHPPSLGVYTLGRYFVSFADIFTVLTGLGYPVSIDISGVTPAYYYLGGDPISADYFRISEMNCWEFIMGVASLFNGIVTYSGGGFHIRAKSDFVDSVATPLNLPLLRGTLQETNKRVGADEVIFRMSGAPQGIRGDDPTTSKIANTTVEKSVTKEIPFRCARIDRTPVIGQLSAQIHVASTDVDYIVYNSTGSWDAAATHAITTRDVAPRYQVELRGTVEWKASFSVMDNAAILPTVMSTLPPILFPAVIGGRSGKYVVRSAVVDLENESVEINVMGYRP